MKVFRYAFTTLYHTIVDNSLTTLENIFIKFSAFYMHLEQIASAVRRPSVALEVMPPL